MSRQAGALFLDRCRIEQVEQAGKVARGVLGTYIDARGESHSLRVKASFRYQLLPYMDISAITPVHLSLIVKAKVVVVCCGSLHTPALLLRSKVPNRHIGTNLRLHPVVAAMGKVPEKVRPPLDSSLSPPV